LDAFAFVLVEGEEPGTLHHPRALTLALPPIPHMPHLPALPLLLTTSWQTITRRFVPLRSRARLAPFDALLGRAQALLLVPEVPGGTLRFHAAFAPTLTIIKPLPHPALRISLTLLQTLTLLSVPLLLRAFLLTLNTLDVSNTGTCFLIVYIPSRALQRFTLAFAGFFVERLENAAVSVAFADYFGLATFA